MNIGTKSTNCQYIKPIIKCKTTIPSLNYLLDYTSTQQSHLYIIFWNREILISTYANGHLYNYKKRNRTIHSTIFTGKFKFFFVHATVVFDGIQININSWKHKAALVKRFL